MEPSYAEAYAELYRRHWWWRARETILIRKVRRLLAGVEHARILDVGCGSALFFDALEPFGHVEGIESDRSAVERSGRWRHRIVAAELDDAFEPSAPFDLVLLLDVLEHVRDPEALLRHAGRVLAPRGRLLITVPALKWLWTSHDEVNHHVTRYTRRAMTRLIQGAGLVTVETRYLFQSLVVPKLLVRAGEAFAGGSAPIPRIPPAALNRALQAWLRVEYGVAGWVPFGSSLLTVAGHQRFAGATDTQPSTCVE